MRTNDAEQSEWFDVTKRLRLDCVILPLLLDMFFSPELHVALVRLSEAECMVQKLIHFNHDEDDRVEEPAVCIRKSCAEDG